ncbi:MAG: hypothetical protein R3D68_07155 [Hyphomicrobiaceae bacterium]
MSQIARLPRDAAKYNPAAVFASPQEVVDEVLMTRGEKMATLERWRIDVLLQLSASDDGMRTYRQSGVLSRTLQKIDAAIDRLAERLPAA